tara:strand:- start:729 stop:1787 length:1059 start_codon:yes stop_codon:yes gene_type:complete
MDYHITDKRERKSFAKVSFSGYKKTDAKKQLQKAILNGRVEPANYWAAELICAGHFLELWEVIILISNRYIHYGNPKLPVYLNLRIKSFKDIMSNGYTDNIIELRNNDKIRELFSEIISILVFSNKKNSFDVNKINKMDFDLTEIKYRLKADKLSYGEKNFMRDDPKELLISVNEFAYSMSSKNKNSSDACYWIDWILEFDRIAKSKKEPLICHSRTGVPVQDKFQKDVIWLIWDVIINSAKHNSIVDKLVTNLYSTFCLHYMNSVKRKRRYILYFAVSIICDKINYSIPLFTNKDVIDAIKSKINIIYKEIKKNEIKPQTDYLFNGLQKSNIDKINEKLEKLNNIGFIPRV